jgi:hypothetical protein
MLILAICVCGHVSEIFDHWDNTFQTGSDIEYSTVIVALIAGAALRLTYVVAVTLRTVSTRCLVSLFIACLPSAATLAVSINHSPPQPLRI